MKTPQEAITAIETALTVAKEVSPESVEKQACIIHLTNAKTHLANRIKHDAEAPKKEEPKQPTK